MQLYARQGDLVFDKLSKLPNEGELKKESGLVLAGRDSAPHTIRGTVLARRNGLMTFIRVTESVVVEHAGRHKPVTLEPGDYEVRPLRERGTGEDRAVED